MEKKAIFYQFSISGAPTFAEVEVDETNQRYTVALRVVERVGDTYRVATEPLMGPLSLPIG